MSIRLLTCYSSALGNNIAGVMCVLCVLCLNTSVQAKTPLPSTTPSSAPPAALAVALPSDWLTIGETRLSVLWFDIYDARLASPTGVFESVESPQLLTLTYLRDIKKSALIKETRKHIKPFANESDRKQWLIQLSTFFPTVKKGDQIAFLIDDTGKGHFFHNQKWIGTLEDTAFSSAFINIWLSDNSQYPKLAKRLRGELRNEANL